MIGLTIQPRQPQSELGPCCDESPARPEEAKGPSDRYGRDMNARV